MGIIRKITRNGFRADAKKHHFKSPNNYVHKMYERFCIEKYGVNARKCNVARGTHKKRVWGYRIKSLFD